MTPKTKGRLGLTLIGMTIGTVLGGAILTNLPMWVFFLMMWLPISLGFILLNQEMEYEIKKKDEGR